MKDKTILFGYDQPNAPMDDPCFIAFVGIAEEVDADGDKGYSFEVSHQLQDSERAKTIFQEIPDGSSGFLVSKYGYVRMLIYPSLLLKVGTLAEFLNEYEEEMLKRRKAAQVKIAVNLRAPKS